MVVPVVASVLRTALQSFINTGTCTNHIGKGIAFNILNPTCVLRVLVTAAGPVVEVPVCQHCTAAEPVTSVVSNTSTGVGRLVGSTATHLSTHCRPGVKRQ